MTDSTEKKQTKTLPQPALSREGQEIKQFMGGLRRVTDHILIDGFLYAPSGYRYLLPACMIAMLFGYVIGFFVPILSLLIYAVAILLIFSEYILNNGIIDYFSTEAFCNNLEGVIHAERETKNRIVISCSIEEGKFGMEKLISNAPQGTVFILNLSAFIYYIFFLVVSLLENGLGAGLPGSVTLFFGLIGVLLLPFVFLFLTQYLKSTKESAVRLTTAQKLLPLFRTLIENRLSETETVFLISGGKSAGARGDKAFCNNHAGDNRKNTLILHIGDIFSADELHVSALFPKRATHMDVLSNSAKNSLVTLSPKQSFFINSKASEFRKKNFQVLSLYAAKSAEAGEEADICQFLYRFLSEYDGKE